MTDANPHYMVPREMALLREMLDKAGVEYYTDEREFPVPFGEGSMVYRTASPDFETDDDGCVAGFSAVIAPYSYGGSDGLLELWAKGMDEPVGWLGADNVMECLRAVGIVGKTTRRD
jgi:hypothetical protein